MTDFCQGKINAIEGTFPGKNSGNECFFKATLIKVVLKPHQTIGSLFPKPKDPVPKDQARGVMYSIPCKDCDKLYIGVTKRKFNTRLREH